ncbi:Tmod2 [Symbiodinium natans]|uniref:Tmod2 protein n=1 Tax=Symbiodinium natans TaxID=878477 RepID=A0A812G733_9DINO|nr:Tmod2 [Symbiodinium natans]
MLAQDRLSLELYWSDRSTAHICEAFMKVPAAPRFDAPIIEFMQTECNFCMEHADGSFMDHLRFCFEYSLSHFKGHSPRVMFLHSILGVGTNYFPMEKEKIPKLRELVNEVEMKHIEAFPSILRLLYHGPLMDELLADAETLPKTLQSISFHRVIDNEPLTLTAEEFWVALNYQLMHQLDFLPAANWAEAVDEPFFAFFLGVYEFLTRAGKLEAEVDFDVKMPTPPSDLARPSMTLGRFIGKMVPGTVKKNIGRQDPALPEGIGLDETTGAIGGVFNAQCSEQTYIVTASGEDGHTSAQLQFAVVLPAPKNLSYPMASPSYAVGEFMSIEPDLEGSEGCTFTVEPALPQGLALDASTGVISGQPEAESSETTYTLSASNASGSATVDLTFQVQEVQTVDAAGIDQKLAAKIEAIEDISEMVEEPAKAKSFGDWMIWMVHRAHLDDPSLTDFDFSNLHMPRGDLEERIAPKLAKAMARNTHIQKLSLVNSNLQKAEGMVLAESLKTNKTLLHLNLENNCLDSAAVKELATNLSENPSSKIETLRVAQQKQVGNSFGRPVEEAFGHLLEKNEAILRLGFVCSDAHWRNLIDRAVLRNNDFARRRRRRNMGEEEEEELTAEEKPLSRLELKTPPSKPACEVLLEGDPAHTAVRGFLIQHRKFPTSSQLQTYAKNNGTSMKFSEAAPALKGFRAAVLEAARGTEVVVADAYEVDNTGIMKKWSIQNDNWNLDIWTPDKKRFQYTSAAGKEPAVSVSADWAAWLSTSAQGGGYPA